MTIHEAAEDVALAWETLSEDGRSRLESMNALNLAVRLRLLHEAVQRVHKLRPGRILEYPNPRPGHGEFGFSGPVTRIPLAEIVVRTDGGPWATHNQPCAVCGQRAAVLNLNEGIMLPCYDCMAGGWELRRKPVRWWQKRYRSRWGVSE